MFVLVRDFCTQHFMINLIDADLASNDGGWQWSASTGTDPQPYFRIFNPVLQSEKVWSCSSAAMISF